MEDSNLISQSTDRISVGNNSTTISGTTKKSPGVFRKVLGSILGGITNTVAPGIGTAIGNMIAGNTSGANYSDMQNVLDVQMQKSMELLDVQNRLQSQTQEFSAFSNLLKAKHDSEMSAINNFK